MFTGPVLLGGAAVWAQHDADGRWRIYRAGARVVKLKTLPAGGSGHLYHPVRLAAGGRSLAVVDTSYRVINGHDMDYATLVDRVLLGSLDRPFVRLAGCGYGNNGCAANPPCGIYGLPSWNVSVGNGTVAWMQACPGPVELDARQVDGGPLLLRVALNPPFARVPALLAANGDYVALLEDNQIVVWDLAAGRELYRLTPPSGQLIARCAIQADGTIALATSANTIGGDPPFHLGWASPAEPFMHPLPGTPVAGLRLSNNRILFAEGPQFGPQRALVLEQIPSGYHRIITNFGPSHSLANDPATLDPSYELDAHHAAWATQLAGATVGDHRTSRPDGPIIQVHVASLP
ncbi:MAG TPA: hypothetical protein VH817_23320 [Thermoleophilaceae bacterium]